MTYQEVLWQGKYVWVTGIVSKSGKCHRYVRKFVGRGGMVLGEAKNGMLLIQFGKDRQRDKRRAIPAGCVTLYSEAKWAD